jgi:hypothetical protein
MHHGLGLQELILALLLLSVLAGCAIGCWLLGPWRPRFWPAAPIPPQPKFQGPR